MIANEHVLAYKYDPYDKSFTREYYDFELMKSNRQKQIAKSVANNYGLILSTLGRQGSPKILDNLMKKLDENGRRHFLVLMSEIFPSRLKLFEDQIDTWVQIGCPRLSIDWGEFFEKPLLTPYEAMVSLKQIEWQKNYPMDFYSYESLGDWTVNNPVNLNRPLKSRAKVKIEYETDQKQ